MNYFIRAPLKSTPGFTLVELLIVMTIVGTLLSLVGPLAIDSLSKAQARSEVLTLHNWIKYQSQRAFITGADVQISLKDKTAELTSAISDKSTREFEYLIFPPQVVVLTQHGFIKPDKIIATIVDQDISIDIKGWNESETK
jgi:prepilin-type N-terminal cleavage/methylation domain-containing protein